MSQRRCHRCGSEVYAESEGSLVYCAHCGAPQIFLSEELQEQAAQLLARENEPAGDKAGAFAADAAHTGALDWQLLIRLAAAVTGSLTLLSLVLAPFALLVWIWAPIAPAIVLALYVARKKTARLNLRYGARVGVVCGLLIIAGQAVVNTIELDLMRFGLKHAAEVDTGVSTVLTPLHTQLVTEYGAQSVAVAELAKPEFRAGFVLAAFCTLAIVIMVLAAAGGATAGYLRSRGRAV